MEADSGIFVGITSNVEKETWPNFFIVGAMRAGTTSLHRYLEAQPFVYMSPVKEPCFFSTTNHTTGLVREKSAYLELFQGATNELARGEASPHYLGDPGTPKRIHDVIPDAKIIMILRDPIERAFSHWFAMYQAWNRETLSFSEAVKVSLDDPEKMKHYLALSLYSDQVQRYRDTFGSDHVKVLIFEEFIHDIQRGVDSILAFLGIPQDRYGKVDSRVHNPSTREIPKNRAAYHIRSSKLLRSVSPILPGTVRMYFRRKLVKKVKIPELELNDKRLLEEFYRNDAKKLSSILGRKFPWDWMYSGEVRG